MKALYITVTLVALLNFVGSVDRNKFRTCEQTHFCKRCREVEPNNSPYILDVSSVKAQDNSVTGILKNTATRAKYSLQLFALADSTFRVQIDEVSPLKPRHRVEHALVDEISLASLSIENTEEKIIVRADSNRAEIYGDPFKIDFYKNDTLLISTNARGLMRFEHLRRKPQPKPDGDQPAETQEVNPDEIIDDIGDVSGAWEENSKSHYDTKPNGPAAVALDFSFPGAEQAYGIPEHADSLALKNTKNGDPYRLFNLDVFEYELDNGMSLYGAIPVLYAHGQCGSSGVFWLNAAETWVDIAKRDGQNMVSSLVSLVSGSPKETPQVDAHFMSESGIIDVFFFLGPAPYDVFRQYVKLTGPAPLPPLFALGYHQSRWNYNSEDDVRSVALNFDKHDIPMDVMWLDIEYTQDKRYFIWDPVKFAHPIEMLNNLTAMGRKLVAISDPHIKRASDYFLDQDAEANGYYVKKADGGIFEGTCWPGNSGYLDFFDPAVRDYYSNRYLLENFPSTLDLHVWNDMNEPSVFSGPEFTMPKDCIHYGGWEHRDVHNQYGFYQVMSTHEGLMRRSGGRFRPFILTRSFFAGTQRYAAMWTGDNMADWSHLAMNVPMCLSVAISGLSMCGADIGGFFRHPSAELFTRWYQAGAFLPFYRAHSIIDTKRREPWLYDEETTKFVRDAIRLRYSYIPLWYTLFYEHERNGTPVIRPLWAEFPNDPETYTIDNEFLVGSSLLVHPVTASEATEVTVYFPGRDEIWYDIYTRTRVTTPGLVQVPVDLSKIPVYQRGGTIIPKWDRVRRSSKPMQRDPYSLIVAPGVDGKARGTLYIDDGETYEYRSGKHLYISFEYADRKLSARFVGEGNQLSTAAWIEKIVILGTKQPVNDAAVLDVPGSNKDEAGLKSDLLVKYDPDALTTVIRKPGVSALSEWSITLSPEKV